MYAYKRIDGITIKRMVFAGGGNCVTADGTAEWAKEVIVTAKQAQ